MTYIIFLLFWVNCLFSASFAVLEGDTLRISNAGELSGILNERLVTQGDAGFALAEYTLDSYVSGGKDDYFIYRHARHEKVKIDTVVFGDYSPREIALLSRYVRFPEKGYFNYTRVRETISRLQELEWLETEDRADIHKNGLRLYTKPKQDLQFDAVASYKESGDDKGIIGHVNCDVTNLFGLGRTASFYWSNPDLDVSEILVSYREPYIFNKPFSVAGEFSQRYEDSSYVKRDLDLSIIYHMNMESDLKITYRSEQITVRDTSQSSGSLKESRFGSDMQLSFNKTFSTLRIDVEGSAGLMSETADLVSHLEGCARLQWRPALAGLNLVLRGARAVSTGTLEDYDKFRLGGAEFLRGSYFEQYTRDRYMGWQLEAGVFSKGLDLYVFYDGAYLTGPVHQAGVAVRLPAGKNHLSLAVGGDLSGAVRDAKFHVLWDM